MRLYLCLLSLASTLSLPTAVSAMDLLEALHLANQNDPNFAAIRASRGLAEQTPNIARSFLLPHVVITGGVSHNDLKQDQITLAPGLPGIGGNSTYDTKNWGVKVTQPLFNWSAYNQFKAAKSQRSRDDAKADEQQQNMILNVAESYFNVLRAEENLALTNSRETALNKKLNESQARLTAGLSPKLDAIESEAQRDNATSQRLAAEDQLNSARERLNASVGVQVNTLAPLDSHMPIAAPIPNDINAWSNLASTNNPKLISLSYDSEANHSAQMALRGEDLPQVNLYAAYNNTQNTGASNSYEAAIASGQTTVVGVEARWDLFSGGHTFASQRQAAYNTELSNLNLQSAQQNIKNQTRSLFMTVTTDASRITANRKNVASAETAYNMIKSGYSVGNQSVIDLFTSDSKLYSARLGLANSRYDYIINSLRLHAAAGTLNEDVIANINHWLKNQ